MAVHAAEPRSFRYVIWLVKHGYLTEHMYVDAMA
jgi:hypothetical protein